jgi:hypothetical protein
VFSFGCPADLGTLLGAQQAPDPLLTLTGRLNLESYKATIKGLTKFGDRRQGTDRNRQALDWIEAQLKSYGCTNTERIRYEYKPPVNPTAARTGAGRNAGPECRAGWIASAGLSHPGERE